jgi:hypothetical protein
VSGYAAQLSALEITYASRKIENLTISKLLFWNAGAETISRTDTEPLLILFELPRLGSQSNCSK